MKDYEGEICPETALPTCKDIKLWVKKKYGLNVNSASITKMIDEKDISGSCA